MYGDDVVFVLVFWYGVVLDDGFVGWLCVELVGYYCCWCFVFEV